MKLNFFAQLALAAGAALVTGRSVLAAVLTVIGYAVFLVWFNFNSLLPSFDPGDIASQFGYTPGSIVAILVAIAWGCALLGAIFTVVNRRRKHSAE